MNYGGANTLSVRTPEGVAFSFRVASPAIRLAAMMVDLGVISVTWSFLAKMVGVIAPINEDAAGLAAILGYFLLSEGYRVVAEWKWRGQTLGKRLLRLRVVDAQGKRLAFEQVAMRNLLRFVDAIPLAYLVGGTAAFISRRGQRLGIWPPGHSSSGSHRSWLRILKGCRPANTTPFWRSFRSWRAFDSPSRRRLPVSPGRRSRAGTSSIRSPAWSFLRRSPNIYGP